MKFFKKIDMPQIILLFLKRDAVMIGRINASRNAFLKAYMASFLISLCIFAGMIVPSLRAMEGITDMKIAAVMLAYIAGWIAWPVVVMEYFKVSGKIYAYLALHGWLWCFYTILKLLTAVLAVMLKSHAVALIAVLFYTFYESFLLRNLLKQDFAMTLILFFGNIFIRSALMLIGTQALITAYAARL